MTDTNIANEIQRGNIPEWAPGKKQVPNIAKDYWRLGNDATMLDLILAVRADEVSPALLPPPPPTREQS